MALEKSIGGSWFAKYEHNCKHDIAESYVAALTMNELLNLAASPDKARERLLNLKLGYSDRFGLTELREALSTLYGKDVKADNVITGHGGVGANQIAYSSVFEPGDNLICIMPTYQQLNSLPKLIGYEVREYWLRPENNYDIEYDVIREMMDERTKMISLTNPNNPSGRLFSRDELARLGDVARERNAYVLCDEAYMEMSHIDGCRQEYMVDIYEKGISTCSISKAFSLPGLRIGWTVTDAELIKQMVEYRHFYTMEMGTVEEYLASIAITNRDKILGRNKKIIDENLALVDEWVRNDKYLSYRRPDAGTVAIVKYDAPVDSVEFCRTLVEKTGFLIMPGIAFGMEGHFRIGLVSPPEITKQALKAISEHLSQFR